MAPLHRDIGHAQTTRFEQSGGGERGLDSLDFLFFPFIVTIIIITFSFPLFFFFYPDHRVAYAIPSVEREINNEPASTCWLGNSVAD